MSRITALEIDLAEIGRVKLCAEDGLTSEELAVLGDLFADGRCTIQMATTGKPLVMSQAVPATPAPAAGVAQKVFEASAPAMPELYVWQRNDGSLLRMGDGDPLVVAGSVSALLDYMRTICRPDVLATGKAVPFTEEMADDAGTLRPVDERRRALDDRDGGEGDGGSAPARDQDVPGGEVNKATGNDMASVKSAGGDAGDVVDLAARRVSATGDTIREARAPRRVPMPEESTTRKAPQARPPETRAAPTKAAGPAVADPPRPIGKSEEQRKAAAFMAQRARIAPKGSPPPAPPPVKAPAIPRGVAPALSAAVTEAGKIFIQKPEEVVSPPRGQAGAHRVAIWASAEAGIDPKHIATKFKTSEDMVAEYVENVSALISEKGGDYAARCHGLLERVSGAMS